MSRIECNRAPGIHLISASVATALYHVEDLVFMKSSELRAKMGFSCGVFKIKSVVNPASKAVVKQFATFLPYVLLLFER
jgi:hypothetical protein